MPGAWSSLRAITGTKAQVHYRDPQLAQENRRIDGAAVERFASFEKLRAATLDEPDQALQVAEILCVWVNAASGGAAVWGMPPATV